jgi:hypothetical protein
MNTRAFALSAVIAGVVMALLGSLPFINFCNCFLCMWVWGSSILAVFLYRQFNSAGPALSVGQGAILGVTTGVIGAVIGFLVEAVFASASLAGAFDLMRSQPALQPFSDAYLQMIKGGGFPILGKLVNLVLYAGFGAVGGLIATALIWKTPTSQPNP